MAISRKDIDVVLERDNRPDGHVLSIYLEVDQSDAANLNGGYLAALKSMLRHLEQQVSEGDRDDLTRNSERALQFVSGFKPSGRGLVLFSDDADDFFWYGDLQVPVRNDCRWNDAPNVRPLVEAIDEYERCCVVLVSKEEARLFAVFLGELEEHREVFAGTRSKHVKSTGKDRPLSQPQIQRRDDEHVQRHLKEVAASLEKFAADHPFQRLVLAGQAPVTKELERLLSKKLQAAVIALISLPTDASEQEVLAETLKLEAGIERATESRVVEDLITAASKANQAVLQLQPTLDALREGRIRKLIYADGFASKGARCANCASLFTAKQGPCAYCGAEIRPMDDIVEHVAEKVVNSGGELENVRGDAAERLRGVGGIGAFLRF